MDLHQFSRKLTLKRFFNIKNKQASLSEPPKVETGSTSEDITTIGKRKNIQGKSKFYPLSSRGNFIDTFHELVQNDLEKLATVEEKAHTSKFTRYNSGFLNKKESQALVSLKKNKDIVIRSADKGGGDSFTRLY